MVRSLKEATVRSFQYETRADLEAHLKAYVAAHNLGRHLKSLRWRTPFQATCDAWPKDPSVFKADPHHLIAGPYRTVPSSVPSASREALTNLATSRGSASS